MTAKTQSLILQILESKADVACLVDTHLDPETEHKIEKLWDGRCYFSHGGDHTAGIAILTRESKVYPFVPDPEGRYGILRLNTPNRKLVICAIYAPAKGPKFRSSFFSNLRSTLIGEVDQDEELVFIGDFNCVESTVLDRSSPRKRDPSVTDLCYITEHFDIADTFRSKFPEAREFTFCSSLGHTSRLDRCYASNSLLDYLVQVEHPPNAFSDHSTVQVSFDFLEVPRGRNSANLPSSLLESEAYLAGIRRLWKGWQSRKSNFTSVLDWWDKGKEEIKTFSLSFVARQRKFDSKHERSITKRLHNAFNGGKTGLVRHFSAKLREIQNRRAQGHFAYRREKWVEEGEKCTAYFLKQHKKQVCQDTVKRIKTSTGLSSDISDILGEFSSFYQELFTESEISEEAKEEVLNLIDLKLTDEQANDCSSSFKIQDLKTALSSTSNGKCPGLDGIPAEFYKTCWDTFSADLFQVFECSFSSGIMPESMRGAVIRCIPKRGDLTEVRNWRPISLLNADYKLFARCIADRISKFLPFVISPSQTATVKSRKIQHNLNLLRNFIFTTGSLPFVHRPNEGFRQSQLAFSP